MPRTPQVAAQNPEVGELPDDVSVDALDVSVELGGAVRQDVLDDPLAALVHPTAPAKAGTQTSGTPGTPFIPGI